MNWKAIPGYENQYEASDSGQVRRIGTGHGSKDGRILQQGDHKQGYKTISLWKNNKGQTCLVHRIIMMTFIGKTDSKLEVNHIDGNKANNYIENLEYVTRSENIQHAMQTGLMNLVGIDNPGAKLTDEQVKEIRASYQPGIFGYKRLAKKYNVSWELIRNIVKNYARLHALEK